MEYPMATLLIGPGAALHEWMHSWYYGMLGTNESLYPWMDEGFTQYAEERISSWLEKAVGLPMRMNTQGIIHWYAVEKKSH